MSSYLRKVKHPETGKSMIAMFIDDYYGEHRYGVGFRKDGKDADWKTKFDKVDFFREETII